MTGATSLHESIPVLHSRMLRGEKLVIELAINASTYMEPDKFFLLKSSSNIKEIIAILQLIEVETLEKCEVAYFEDATDELLGEFPVKQFMEFYNVDRPLQL